MDNDCVCVWITTAQNSCGKKLVFDQLKSRQWRYFGPPWSAAAVVGSSALNFQDFRDFLDALPLYAHREYKKISDIRDSIFKAKKWCELNYLSVTAGR